MFSGFKLYLQASNEIRHFQKVENYKERELAVGCSKYWWKEINLSRTKLEEDKSR